MWLPTYRVSTLGDIRNDAKNSSFLDDLDGFFLEELNDICFNENIVVAVKLHPMDSTASKLKGFSFSNIVFYDTQTWLELDIELYDLISISSGVITDFSSVMVDCNIANIPVGIIESSKESYKRDILLPFDELIEMCISISFPSDVLRLLGSGSGSGSDKKNHLLDNLCVEKAKANSCKELLDFLLR